tara:strand:+ start:12958 stop:13398 length:441 start_codon:yes stop_codon:yes gene_type:complete
MTAVIVDLDGTLCDCVHRQHHAQQSQWDEFHAKLMDDDPYWDVQWFLRKLPETLRVLAVTGRNEGFRQMTYDWLDKHSIVIDDVLMRPTGDFRPDDVLKPQLLQEHFGSKDLVIDNVIFVLDDRDKVVEAWRNYGLTCWQVRPGGY